MKSSCSSPLDKRHLVRLRSRQPGSWGLSVSCRGGTLGSLIFASLRVGECVCWGSNLGVHACCLEAGGVACCSAHLQRPGQAVHDMWTNVPGCHTQATCNHPAACQGRSASRPGLWPCCSSAGCGHAAMLLPEGYNRPAPFISTPPLQGGSFTGRGADLHAACGRCRHVQHPGHQRVEAPISPAPPCQPVEVQQVTQVAQLALLPGRCQ